MTTRQTILALLSVSAVISLGTACDDGTTTFSPTPPATEHSFLEGTWRGPVTIHRNGLPDTDGTTTWTFALVPNTGQTSFYTTMTVEPSVAHDFDDDRLKRDHPGRALVVASVRTARMPHQGVARAISGPPGPRNWTASRSI